MSFDRPEDRCNAALSPAVVEALEDRKLLAATLEGTLLNVVGTSKSDKISLSYSKDGSRFVVLIGKKSQQFVRKGIRKIRIDGAGGSDTVKILGLVKQRMSIFGGSGSDAIFGHNGKEGVDGGTGNDTIVGAGGSDNLMGGDGDDFIVGGTAHDKINGNAGHDLLFGDGGNDTVNGHDGNDTLGGDDEDVLSFTSPIDNEDAIGRDKLDGGTGDDVLLSGVRSASIPDSSGQDTFIGGDGADVLDARGGDDSLLDLAAEDFVPTSEFTSAVDPGPTHTHPVLRIFVRVKGGYARVVIPNGIGIFGNTISQFADLHTHDFSGTIHFESGTANDNFTLKEFFQIWGITFSATHVGRYVGTKAKPITMKVDGVNNTQFENYQPQHGETVDIFVG